VTDPDGRSTTAADSLLLALHGHGDRPEDLRPTAERLVAGTTTALAIPAAPLALATGGRAWWPEHEETPATDTLSQLIATVEPTVTRVWVAGFSQGAATALATAHRLAATRPSVLAGVVVVAGFLPGAPVTLPAGTAVLVVHGRLDDVVDPFHGELVARRLRRQDCAVDEVLHDGGHVWDDTVTAAVRQWLQRSGATPNR